MELSGILSLVAFVVVIGINLARFINNKRSPEVTERATVKRKLSSTHVDADGAAVTALTLLFQIGDRERRGRSSS